jgi:hypothetical protein
LIVGFLSTIVDYLLLTVGGCRPLTMMSDWKRMIADYYLLIAGCRCPLMSRDWTRMRNVSHWSSV